MKKTSSCKLLKCSRMTISLPDIVQENEKLARIICASSKPKNYEQTAYRFDESSKRNIVLTAQFIDKRYPSELSVNRISSLTLEESHNLGLEHQQKRQSNLTYHGFAEITAKICFDNNCQVKKEDYDGEQPYHANIIYPYPQESKEDKQEIAVQLAYNAEFRKYSDTQ